MGNSNNLPSNNLVVLLHLEDEKKIRTFIESDTNFDINQQINKMRDTILHYAAYKGNENIVRYLLEKGANPQLKNSRDLTPIDVCEKKEIRDMLTGAKK